MSRFLLGRITSGGSMRRNKPPVGFRSRTAPILLAPAGARCALERMPKGVEWRPVSPRDAPPPPFASVQLPLWSPTAHATRSRGYFSRPSSSTYAILCTAPKSDFLSIKGMEGTQKTLNHCSRSEILAILLRFKRPKLRFRFNFNIFLSIHIPSIGLPWPSGVGFIWFGISR
jgi:hypothetical protein